MVLHRWLRDYQGIGQTVNLAIPEVKEEAIVLTRSSVLLSDGKVMFEEIDLDPPSNPKPDEVQTLRGQADAIAKRIAETAFKVDTNWKPVFMARFGIVHDDTFTFLTETATEVTARISLNQATKTVKDGGLWYEETLPPESILTCPVMASLQGARAVAKENNLGLIAAKDKLLRVVNNGLKEPVQMGGDASIGHGMIQANLDWEGAES
jgi:CRISPR-associated protein Cmr4